MSYASIVHDAIYNCVDDETSNKDNIEHSKKNKVKIVGLVP